RPTIGAPGPPARPVRTEKRAVIHTSHDDQHPHHLAALLAHLAALDARPSVYAAQGYGSLHAYCTQALRLSEDAASSRIAAARACQRFPVILDLLASGEMTLTSVRLLARHLTPENHQAALAKAGRRTI